MRRRERASRVNGDVSAKTPETGLWVEVLSVALDDVKGVIPSVTAVSAGALQRETWAWVDSEDFREVCDLAGVDADATFQQFTLEKEKAGPQARVLLKRGKSSRWVWIPKNWAKIGPSAQGYEIIEIESEDVRPEDSVRDDLQPGGL